LTQEAGAASGCFPGTSCGRPSRRTLSPTGTHSTALPIGGEAHLTRSERILLRLAANLAHGDIGAGEGLNLQQLWMLDGRNRAVVLRALENVPTPASGTQLD
jgi:hypothetical protein